MAKKKYKKKPESWYCIQYTGTNVEEMTSFCPDLAYHTDTGKLMFGPIIVVDPTNWVLQDNAGIFSVMIDSQFNAFFELN